MGLIAYRFRATFRRRWRSLLGIAVLLGVTGGLSLTAIAGARRTQSALPRFLEAANSSTVSANAGDFDPDFEAAVGACLKSGARPAIRLPGGAAHRRRG